MRLKILILSVAVVFSPVFLYSRFNEEDKAYIGILLRGLIKDDFPVIVSVRNYEIDTKQKKLVFIGDVHGKYHELIEMLEDKLKVDDNTKVVLLGDFLVRGPDSAKVSEYILANKDRIDCILGNNELSVIFAMLNGKKSILKYNNMNKSERKEHGHSLFKSIPFDSERYIPYQSKVNADHWAALRDVGRDKLVELCRHCSILNHYRFHNKKLIAVHAGVLPDAKGADVNINTMVKYIDPLNWTRTSKKEFPGSIPWFKVWNDKYNKERQIVIYGHDARNGVNLREYTKGLDGGCVKGKELVALEYDKDEEILHRLQCKKDLQ